MYGAVTGASPAQAVAGIEKRSHFSALVPEKSETKAPAKPGSSITPRAEKISVFSQENKYGGTWNFPIRAKQRAQAELTGTNHGQSGLCRNIWHPAQEMGRQDWFHGRGFNYSLQVHPPDVGGSHIHIHHLPDMHSVGIKKPKLNSQALQHSLSLREAEAPRQPHGRGQETLQGWGETPRGAGPPSTPQNALAPSR